MAEISVKEYIGIMNEDIDISDAKYGISVTCTVPYPTQDHDFIDQFTDLICSNVYITESDGERATADWSSLIEQNESLFREWSDLHWKYEYTDKDEFISEWIGELHYMFAGYVPDEIYKEACEHFSKIQPVPREAKLKKSAEKTIEAYFQNKSNKPRLFVDMDGTLAEFKVIDTFEKLLEENYFFNLRPNWSVVEAIKLFKVLHPDIEVFILSAYLTESDYALKEKNMWLDKYFGEIDQEHRIFVPCGESKAAAIKGGISQTDFLLDDYTINLNEWEPPAKGIKLLNSINGTKGTWKKNRISYDREPADIASCIYKCIQGEKVMDIPLSRKNKKYKEKGD